MASASANPSITEPVPQKKVLVVDSGPELNETLTGVLKEGGWIIERAPDNKAVFALLKENPFDLIITSQGSHEKEDVALLHEIRNVRPQVRMIILTDESTTEEVIDAIREGVFSFFCPPYSRDMLSEMIDMAMARPTWDDGIEIISATPNWVRLIVRCELGTADRLVQFLRCGSTLSGKEKQDVIQAFREILLNAMEHGGHYDPSQYVEVSFFRGQHVVLCRVKDPGQGFSLEEIRHAAYNCPPEEILNRMAVRQEMGLRPGGFGVMMATNLVDEVVYNEQGNEVLLVKYIGLNAPKESEQ